MARTTKIAWADSTWNPWLGCSHAGPGCDHCYAETLMDKRMHVVQWGPGNPRKRTISANWRKPIQWNAERARAIAAGENPPPHYVFCASLADVFDNEVDPQWRADLFALIHATPNLTWLLLTKRIGNASKMIAEALVMQDDPIAAGAAWPWPHVWLGATIVNQDEAERDIHKLIVVLAAKHFLSIEPMLGPISLASLPISVVRANPFTGSTSGLTLQGAWEPLGDGGVDWVILGFESGTDARPGHPDWARKVRDDCAAAGVPFLFKQWGEWCPGYIEHGNELGYEQLCTARQHEWPEGYCSFRVGTKAAGNRIDGKQHLEFPA